MRAKEWPPSRVKARPCGVAGFLSKLVPHESSSSTRCGPFLDDDLDGLVIAKPGAAFFGVVHMDSVAVGRLKHRGDAALGIPGVGLVDGVLGEQQDVGPLIGRRDRRPQPRHAAADHQDIRELLRQPGGFEGDQISTLGEGLKHGADSNQTQAIPRPHAAAGVAGFFLDVPLGGAMGKRTRLPVLFRIESGSTGKRVRLSMAPPAATE